MSDVWTSVREPSTVSDFWCHFIFQVSPTSSNSSSTLTRTTSPSGSWKRLASTVSCQTSSQTLLAGCLWRPAPCACGCVPWRWAQYPKSVGLAWVWPCLPALVDVRGLWGCSVFLSLHPSVTSFLSFFLADVWSYIPCGGTQTGPHERSHGTAGGEAGITGWGSE